MQDFVMFGSVAGDAVFTAIACLVLVAVGAVAFAATEG